MRKLFLLLLVMVSRITSAQIDVDRIPEPTKYYDGIQLFNMSYLASPDRILSLDDTGIISYTFPQLTAKQVAWIEENSYENYSPSVSLSLTSGERGVNNSFSLTYNVASNDDSITAASFNQSIGSVLDSIDGGNKTITGLSSTTTKTFTLTIDYDRNEVAGTGTHSATYSAYIPQYAGWSSSTDFDGTYAPLNGEANFTKYVTSSTTITKSFSPTGEYVWFITNLASPKIYDGNNFLLSTGAWGDTTKEYWVDDITLTLADGSVVAAKKVRSRTVKTLDNFTIKITP